MTFGGPNCTEVLAPTHLSYLSGTLSILMTFVTFPSNLLVCLAILLDPHKELRTPFNCLLLSLAATDLLVGSAVDPLLVIFHYSEAVEVQLVSIKIVHILFFALSTASLLTLSALTVERYIAVAFPYHAYKTTLTSKRLVLAPIVIWLISLGLSFIYFPLGYIYYSFIFENGTVVSTLLVLLFAYWSIYRKLREQSKMFERTDRENRKKRIKDTKVTNGLLVMLLVFIICFTPAGIMADLLNLCSQCSCVTIHWLRDIQILLVLSNSGVNPFVYAFRLKKFRRAFSTLARLSTHVSPCFSERVPPAPNGMSMEVLNISRLKDFRIDEELAESGEIDRRKNSAAQTES